MTCLPVRPRSQPRPFCLHAPQFWWHCCSADILLLVFCSVPLPEHAHTTTPPPPTGRRSPAHGPADHRFPVLPGASRTFPLWTGDDRQERQTDRHAFFLPATSLQFLSHLCFVIMCMPLLFQVHFYHATATPPAWRPRRNQDPSQTCYSCCRNPTTQTDFPLHECCTFLPAVLHCWSCHRTHCLPLPQLLHCLRCTLFPSPAQTGMFTRVGLVVLPTQANQPLHTTLTPLILYHYFAPPAAILLCCCRIR